MSQSEKFSLATHLYVRVRRSANRVIDAAWMSQNDEYAKEILRIASKDPDPETQNLVQRFEMLLPGYRPPAKPRAVPAFVPAELPPMAEAEAAQNYIGSLR
jgi:hypothetical protein